MNIEVIAMVEDKVDEQVESCTEGEFVELGLVSKDTKGWGFLFSDGGATYYLW